MSETTTCASCGHSIVLHRVLGCDHGWGSRPTKRCHCQGFAAPLPPSVAAGERTTEHDFPTQEERTGMRVGMPSCRACGVRYGSREARQPCSPAASSPGGDALREEIGRAYRTGWLDGSVSPATPSLEKRRALAEASADHYASARVAALAKGGAP